MKKISTPVHSLHGKFLNIKNLYEKLDKIPRKFGTDELLGTREIHLIELIGDNQNPSVTDLAKLQGVTKGAISQNLKRLEQKGFTEKETDPANTSRSLISLTNKGKTAYYAHIHWHETMDGGFKEYLGHLDQDKLDFINDFLTRIETFFKQRIETEQ
jgi:DNA-binding MarR family transcriptional regulator